MIRLVPQRPQGPLLALLLLSVPLVIAWGVPRGAASAIKRGNAAYRQGKYDESLREYASIEDAGPVEHVVRFNSAGALYKKTNDKAAVEEYQRALGSGADFDAQVHYNIGNCHFRMGRVDDAIASYKRALELAPTDTWAKHNLELALRRKRQQQPQESQSQPQQKREDEERSDGQQMQSPGQDQSAKPQKQPAGAAQAALTPEEALRLLRAAASEDAALQKQVLRMRMEPVPAQMPEKDW